MSLELLQVSGLLASLALVISALSIRYTRAIDTTALSADWSLLLIAAAGACMTEYFWLLHDPARLAVRGGAVLGAVGCYIAALLLWFFDARRQIRRVYPVCSACDADNQR